MRKSFVFLMLLGAMACSKLPTENINSRELVLSAEVSCSEITRGLIADNVLDDADGRTISLSAYDVTAAGNYFTGTVFTKSSDDIWRSSLQPVYWYRDNRLNVLAVSASSSSPVLNWNKDNASSRVSITVNSTSLRDDILYASANNCTAESGIELGFNHSQAYVEFIIIKDLGSDELNSKLTVNSITIKNAICSGVININNAGSAPVCSWDTSESVPADCVLPVTGSSAFALLPQQPKPSTIVADIVYDGVEKKAQLIINDNTYWLAARHHKYLVTFEGDLSTKSAASVDSNINNIKVELSEEVLPW